MAFNPLALLQERQCAPIYDALDAGRTTQALKQCNDLLKTQPELHLAIALKSVAMVRLGRKEEANTLVDRLIQSEAASKSSSVLTALSMSLSSLGRTQDEVEMLDSASKANSNSLDIGSKAFAATVKAKQWQKAQQIASRLHKVASAKDKKNDDYFWSAMQAYSIIANDPSLPGSKLALPLAQRMIAKHIEALPFGPRSDEIVFLYASILRKMGGTHIVEALKLLNGDSRGKELCQRSMTLSALRYELLEEVEQWQTIYSEAMDALEKGDENWTRVQQAVKAAIRLSASESGYTLAEIEARLSALSDSKEKIRTLRLAPLYLFKEARLAGQDASSQLQKFNLLEAFTRYFDTFGIKACAFEDLAPYAPLLSTQEAQTVQQFLTEPSQIPSKNKFDDLNALYLNLNACNLLRLVQTRAETTSVTEMAAAKTYFSLYLSALPIGKDLPKTEMQPADEYALLTCQSLVHANFLEKEEEGQPSSQSLLIAIVVLRVALIYSPKGYRLRILLVHLLLQCGAVDLARIEYEAIGVKAIQHDTLGWIIANRASSHALLLSSSEEKGNHFATAMHRLQSVWKDGKMQVPQMIVKSFGTGIYSRVEELVDFGERLEYSLTRWLVAIETARSTSISQGVDKDLREELQECQKSLLNGKISDQQDHDVLLNLMPHSCLSIQAMIGIAGRSLPGIKYLKAMLSVAMAHQDLPMAEEAKLLLVEDGKSGYTELSQEELLLVKLSNALVIGDGGDVGSLLDELLRVAQENMQKQGPHSLPCGVLHPASIAVEAFELLASVKKKRNAKVTWDGEASQVSYRGVLEALQGIEWGLSAKITDDWLVLLGKLPTALREGRNAQDVVTRQVKELQQQHKDSKEALLHQMEKHLS